MRIAVTGGAGFIGSHLVDALAGRGDQVVVVDPRPPHRADVEHADADITDLVGLRQAFAGCAVVFHLAAVSNVNHVYAGPVEALDVNVGGTGRVWQAARDCEVGRVLLASTVWVYAAATGPEPLTETSPTEVGGAGHLYTATKIAAEMVAHSFQELYGQAFTILRYGIPFGPRMREELVIPRFVRMALAREPISIDGDGSQYRNYVYIDDLIDAHLRSLGPAGENATFNLEGPEPVSIRRITEALAGVLGRPLDVSFGPPRPGDYGGREVSGAKAAAELGWVPRIRFEEGLARFVEWYTEGAGRRPA